MNSNSDTEGFYRRTGVSAEAADMESRFESAGNNGLMKAHLSLLTKKQEVDTHGKDHIGLWK